MRLLEAEKAEEQSKKGEKQIEKRIDALRAEESRAINDLNEAKARSEAQKQYIKEETDKFIALQKIRANEARKEADSMESFRKDVLRLLLKPIDEMHKEADLRLADVKQKELDMENEKKAINELRNTLSSKESDLEEREKKIAKIDASFSEREDAIKKREKEVKAFMARREKKVQEELNRARQILEASQHQT